MGAGASAGREGERVGTGQDGGGQMGRRTVRPTTGLFRTVEPNSPRTVYGLPLYRFDLCYIVYMVRNTIFHHAKVLPLGFLGAYGLPDAP